MIDQETRDWRRVALVLADALEAILLLRGKNERLSEEPISVPEPAPTGPIPVILDGLPEAEYTEENLETPHPAWHPALNRLRNVIPGTCVRGPSSTDLGYVCNVQYDHESMVVAFGLAQKYRVGTPGVGEAEGPIKSVWEWAADGWDLVAYWRKSV